MKKPSRPRLPRVQRADIRRGDVVVVEVPEHLSDDQTHTVIANVRRIWPRNRVLVLDGGKQLKIGMNHTRK